MSNLFRPVLIASALTAALAAPVTHAAEAQGATVTGNIGVVSKYILRGITQTYNATYDNSGPEMDSPALQGGLDYVHPSGFYAGYWFSTIGYSYEHLDPDSDKTSRNSFENDFYAGYNGKYGDIGYSVGGTLYYYLPGWESTGFETKVSMSYKDFGISAQTLLNDVTFGNQGDTYILATYTHKLPRDFTFTGSLGYYLYGKDGEFYPETVTVTRDDGSTYDVTGKSGAFRHLTLGVTHPLGATGATMGLQYIVGGDNRYGLKQENTIVGSVGFTF